MSDIEAVAAEALVDGNKKPECSASLIEPINDMFGEKCGNLMREMLDRALSAVSLEKSTLVFEFQDGGRRAFYAGADCWMELTDLPEKLEGATVLGFSASGITREKVTETLHEICFDTDRGPVVLEHHQVSKGSLAFTVTE